MTNNKYVKTRRIWSRTKYQELILNSKPDVIRVSIIHQLKWSAMQTCISMELNLINKAQRNRYWEIYRTRMGIKCNSMLFISNWISFTTSSAKREKAKILNIVKRIFKIWMHKLIRNIYNQIVKLSKSNWIKVYMLIILIIIKVSFKISIWLMQIKIKIWKKR